MAAGESLLEKTLREWPKERRDAERRKQLEATLCDICGEPWKGFPWYLVGIEDFHGDATGWVRCCDTTCAHRGVAESKRRFLRERGLPV